MEVFLNFMKQIYHLFAMEMNIFGFVFSFWDILMFSLVAGIVFSFIGRVFNGES